MARRDRGPGRPGTKITDTDDAVAQAHLAEMAEQGFAVESGVNTEGRAYARVWFGESKQVMDTDTGWTIVRLLAEALAAAEADALIHSWARREVGPDKAAYMIGAMREERGRADVSAERRHFYKRITDR